MSKANTPVSIDLTSVQTRFAALRGNLAATFRERESAIECITLAALAGNHALLVGPPGTAKSALFFGFLASFTNARTFQRVLTKFGTEDDVFGPVKLSALKNDILERNLTGRLASVECAFMDEVFKGSDSVLNTLLEAMNERRYQGQAIPLRMMVGASNELPEEDVLAAMYDRFLLRDVVSYIESDSVWMDLVSTPPKYTPKVFITVEEWDAARAAVAALPLPRRVVEQMLRVKNELKQAGIIVSDRRWIAMTNVLRAAAWIDGCAQVEIDHLEVLKYGLWSKPEERERVTAVLASIDAGPVKQAVEMLDEALRAYASRPTERALYLRALPKIAATVVDQIKSVKVIMDQGVSVRAARRIEPKLAELMSIHAALKVDLAARYSFANT